MAESDGGRTARASYRALASGDRAFFEEHLADGFRFSSPPDRTSIGRAGSSDAGREPDGGCGRNTEVLNPDGEGRILRTEVYFGWDLE